MKTALAALAVFTLGGAGSWQRLPASPVRAETARGAVWTGKRVLVFGRHSITAKDARGNPYVVKTVDVAASYDPAAKAWQKLTPPVGAGYSPSYATVWTGTRMLVWGPFDALSYDPAANRWRTLPRPPTNAGRLAVWTGKELVGWGGGCCGDAFSDGAAYNPATNRWRKLPVSPLAGSQSPVGAWTGRELVILVGNLDPDGKPWPARLARAAAYDPARNSWRRLPPLPDGHTGALAVWDGKEVLVVGGGKRGGFAFDPATNRWRRIDVPALFGVAVTAWTGPRLLALGGRSGFAFDPRTNRSTRLPAAPFAVGDVGWTWTGRGLFVWNGRAAAAYMP